MLGRGSRTPATSGPLSPLGLMNQERLSGSSHVQPIGKLNKVHRPHWVGPGETKLIPLKRQPGKEACKVNMPPSTPGLTHRPGRPQGTAACGPRSTDQRETTLGEHRAASQVQRTLSYRKAGTGRSGVCQLLPGGSAETSAALACTCKPGQGFQVGPVIPALFHGSLSNSSRS